MHWRKWMVVALCIMGLSCSSTKEIEQVHEPISQNAAVLSLLEAGRSHSLYGEYAMAKSKLERALRIEPKNAYLWLELARVSLAEGEYGEAKNLAQRARSLASGNIGLIEEIKDFTNMLDNY